MKFVNMRGIIALKDGMLAILPLGCGKSILIVGQLPFEGLNQAIAGVFGQTDRAFMQVWPGTLPLWGWFPVFQLAILGAKNSGVEPLPAGVLSLSSFLYPLKLPTQKRVKQLQMRLPRSGLAVKESLGPSLLLGSWQYLYDFHSKAYCHQNARAFSSDCQFEARSQLFVNACLYYCQDSDWWRHLYWDDLRCHSGASARSDGLSVWSYRYCFSFLSCGGSASTASLLSRCRNSLAAVKSGCH